MSLRPSFQQGYVLEFHPHHFNWIFLFFFQFLKTGHHKVFCFEMNTIHDTEETPVSSLSGTLQISSPGF